MLILVIIAREKRGSGGANSAIVEEESFSSTLSGSVIDWSLRITLTKSQDHHNWGYIPPY
jgi:hypothetical protein